MILSQAFEDQHFTEREISFETLNEVRRIWIAASGLEDSAKTPPGYDRITIFAQATFQFFNNRGLIIPYVEVLRNVLDRTPGSRRVINR
jgi:hypothetical protein